MTTPVIDDLYASKREPSTSLGDLVALAKPRVTALVIATTAGGLWLAPLRVGVTVAGLALLGTVLIVAGANALNMYIERDIDGRMDRTKGRPLPAGRLAPRVALWFGSLSPRRRFRFWHSVSTRRPPSSPSSPT